MMPTIYSTRNQEWLPSIFNDFLNDNWVSVPKFSGTTPAINVTENEQNYEIEVAAPGMCKEDFNISLTKDGDIVIAMEKKSDNKEEEKDKKYLRREFSYSKYEQCLTLPDNADKENISASMNNGILDIKIPKLTEEEKEKETKFIEIK
ncbi:HSP20 family protein [Bacteroidales bacterium KHT7]|jgi:HSP20 family protein|uniref:Hsp20/alpha crystallin family protein n=1 Tax=unclassified Bacteroides TaxID=2646097 RepID=UPI0004E1BEDE|nr:MULTISPECIES: Hsp20/alpha crystallin family protein [unclassified Bacteroides]MBP5221038.1 Hsp20/alpha crystallin family protein [Bacteroidaceae bacterium]SDG16461.1 HSP20 family protein [Bacteroidales bacterium KHT7]MBQ2054884.1 Hsp20/alpha crystallin family protein [Bacteroidaceae bacterium]MBQ3875798.1 Hsp20/alpha crystallin family protein [Bacteroidaceae bacterium]MBQ5476743.1 Hsp20/alpha crystallin family protein [Bacteroidaceae bacterium]